MNKKLIEQNRIEMKCHLQQNKTKQQWQYKEKYEKPFKAVQTSFNVSKTTPAIIIKTNKQSFHVLGYTNFNTKTR